MKNQTSTQHNYDQDKQVTEDELMNKQTSAIKSIH